MASIRARSKLALGAYKQITENCDLKKVFEIVLNARQKSLSLFLTRKRDLIIYYYF